MVNAIREVGKKAGSMEKLSFRKVKVRSRGEKKGFGIMESSSNGSKQFIYSMRVNS